MFKIWKEILMGFPSLCLNLLHEEVQDTKIEEEVQDTEIEEERVKD